MTLRPYSFEPTINDIDSNFNHVLFVNKLLNTNMYIENRSLKLVNEWCLIYIISFYLFLFTY